MTKQKMGVLGSGVVGLTLATVFFNKDTRQFYRHGMPKRYIDCVVHSKPQRTH